MLCCDWFREEDIPQSFATAKNRSSLPNLVRHIGWHLAEAREYLLTSLASTVSRRIYIYIRDQNIVLLCIWPQRSRSRSHCLMVSLTSLVLVHTAHYELWRLCAIQIYLLTYLSCGLIGAIYLFQWISVVSVTWPDHFSFDDRRVFRYFDRFHVEKDRMLLVGFWLRQQRMKQDSSSRVDQKSVGQLCKTKVNDGTEQRIQTYIDACDALEFSQREHG